MKKFMLIITGMLILSCNRDSVINEKVKDKNLISMSSSLEFNKKLNAISFKSKDDLSNFIDNYQENSDVIGSFYNEGFIPYRVKDGVSEDLFNNLVLAKKKILSENDDESETEVDIDEEEDAIISNDKFASLLNAKGEILVDGKVYRYTEKGLYIADEENIEHLDSYLSKNQISPNIGLNQIDDKIQSYVPDRDQFKDFEIEETSRYLNLHINIGNTQDIEIPSNTSHYDNCVPSRPWVDNIFGRNYACEYKFSKKRKLRSVFAVEDYFLFFDVYAQAKFKQKTWFGWFSSREANKVYVKINNANITLGDRKIRFKLNTKDVQKVFTEIGKLLDGSKNKKVSYLSNIYTENNGNPLVENYAINNYEILHGANNNVGIITPTNRRNIPNISINFKELFGKTPKKVFVITILGKEHSITDDDIYKIAFDAYKQFVQSQRKSDNNSTGVVVLKKDVSSSNQTEDGEVVSYAFGNEITSVRKQAVARRKFDIPKRFKIDKLLLDFQLKPPFVNSVDIDMSWKKPEKYEVDIETGAYYNGRWGGSKFKVTKK